MKDTDEFTEKMWQHMLLVNQEATKKITALRGEVKQLRAELKDHEPQLWALAEELCCAELTILTLRGQQTTAFVSKPSATDGTVKG